MPVLSGSQTPCKSLAHHQPIQVHGKCFSGLCSRTSHLGINGTEGFTAVVGTEVRDRKNPGWRLRAGSAEGARSAQGFWEERTQKRGWWQVLGWGINPSMNWLGWAGGGLTPFSPGVSIRKSCRALPGVEHLHGCPLRGNQYPRGTCSPGVGAARSLGIWADFHRFVPFY